MELISRKLCRFLFAFDLLYFIQCLTSFSSIGHLLCLYAKFLMLSLLTDEVLWINPSANEFVLEEFNIHHKDWLTYSNGTDRLCELRYNFSISNDLTFLLRSLTVSLTVLLFRTCFFLLMLVFVLQWLYLQWEILIMMLF